MIGRSPGLFFLALAALSGAVHGCGPSTDGASAPPHKVPMSELPTTPSPPAASSTADPQAPTAQGATVDAAMQERIRKAFWALADRKAADAWPEKDASGVLRTPSGNPISAAFLLGHDRPKEQEGTPFTAMVSLEEKVYWVHEGGGISGIDRNYGPFPIP